MRLLLFSCALALIASFASPAAACTGAPNCLGLRTVVPADGAANVPRTVELRITYGGARLEPSSGAVLETDDGTVVPTRWERVRTQSGYGWSSEVLWVGQVATPLAASTHYRLRHLYRDCSETDASTPPYCQELCVDTVGEVISEFTTGTAIDEAPLAAPTILGAVTMSVDSCDSSGCCGPYVRCLYSVELSALEPGQQVRVTKENQLVAYSASASLRVAVSYSGSGYDNGVTFNGSGEYQLVVTDGTSKRSPATTLTIPACAVEQAPQPDATMPDAAVRDAAILAAPVLDAATHAAPDGAAPAAPDARAALDAGEPAEPNATHDDGCALAGSRTPWAWFAIALVLWRRRRRA